MKKAVKKVGLGIVAALLFASCDSSSDPITPVVVPSTFEFVWLKAPNITTPNASLWNLKKEITAGATFTSPVNLRSDDFATAATFIPSASLIAKQCSAYDKVSKRYVVSSGERIVVYNFNTVSGSPALEFQFSVSNVQAMEFANGRFFAIKNNKLNEYDFTSTTPTTPLSSFTEITLATGQVSNLTQKGNYLSVISGGHLYVINTSGLGAITLDYPSLSATETYEGLEAINSAGAPFSLFVVKRNGTTNEFQEILLTSSLAFTSITTKYSLSFIDNPGAKISSALDYTTEFYYLNSYNGGGSNSVTAIDLTPTNPSTYVPTTIAGSGNNYAFGLQLKD